MGKKFPSLAKRLEQVQNFVQRLRRETVKNFNFGRGIGLLSLFAIVTLATACGGAAVSSARTPAPTPVHTAVSASPQTVTVTIDAGDFYIKSSQATFKVGVPYHFVLHNSGKLPHEVMLMPVMKPSKGMSMEDMDKVALGMVEQENFPAGANGSFDVTFSKAYGPGELEFACHIPGHYEAGMHSDATVTQ